MPKYIAEFIGTFFLVFAGTGAIIVNDMSGGSITHLGIAVAFGLAVTTMIYAMGAISGAHLNPAVSYGFWMAGRFPSSELFPYIMSQCLGAVSASILWRFLIPEHATLGMTQPAGPVMQSFILEFVLTFFLMIVIMRVSTGAREVGIMAGAAIGGLVCLEALFAGKISGASMNPARSLAPALVVGDWQYLWIYFAAPVMGAHAGIVICRWMCAENCCDVPSGDHL